MKMPTIYGIFIFISREMFMLSYLLFLFSRKKLQLLVIWDLLAVQNSCSAESWVEHEKCFISSGLIWRTCPKVCFLSLRFSYCNVFIVSDKKEPKTIHYGTTSKSRTVTSRTGGVAETWSSRWRLRHRRGQTPTNQPWARCRPAGRYTGDYLYASKHRNS